jgi:LL-diaminopimelate aminotransferase
MSMRLSERIDKLSPYLFVGISQKIAAKKARGEEVISFAIGDPDIPTPDHIIEALCQSAHDSINHHYPESAGLPEFRRAVAVWYHKRFGVTLDPDQEVVSLIGAKEGIAHIALCLIDTNDIALVPDPGYPVYTTGTRLCGGQTYYLPLNENNHFLPDLESIPQDILQRAKVLWLNYPNNPTGAVAGLNFFTKAAEFARKNNIAICHDGPYSEVAFDGYQPVSFMQAPGAKETGIEFHSLSKSYNMTGWRIGMAVGNAALIDALRRVKSNLDSGIPMAIQHAAIAALTGPQNCIDDHNKIYQKRRDRIVQTLNQLGIKASLPQAGLYIWAKAPEGYTSVEFADELLDRVNIVVTPGTGYGPSGEGYVRLSLTIPDVLLEKGLIKLVEWKDQRKQYIT